MISTQTTTRPLWLQMKGDRFTPDQILRYFKVSAPPIDVFGIAKAMGVQLCQASGANWSGALQATKEAATIFVKKGEIVSRQRFTVAHELGHLMLHELGNEYRDRIDPTQPGSSQHEREANAFAAQLIMPDWLVRVAVDRMGAKIVPLAEAFIVSESAMEYRLRALYGR